MQRRRTRDQRAWPDVIWTLVSVAAIAILVVTFAQFDSFFDGWLYQGGYVLVNAAIGLLVWSLTSRRNLLVQVSGFSLFLGSGRISFPLFLLIFPVPPTSWVVAAGVIAYLAWMAAPFIGPMFG